MTSNELALAFCRYGLQSVAWLSLTGELPDACNHRGDNHECIPSQIVFRGRYDERQLSPTQRLIDAGTQLRGTIPPDIFFALPDLQFILMDGSPGTAHVFPETLMRR